MKSRFNTLDVVAILKEINSKLVGMRLVNVYDLNNKTYLLKLTKQDAKSVLLIESGIRLHMSEFDWPKNMIPSGFSMKLRKHLRGRRFVSATQLGIDRIVDIQFGYEEAAYHVIIELYDRGNIALTDYQYIILTLLRFRKDKTNRTESGDNPKEENSDVKFAVHEPYPFQLSKQKVDVTELKSTVSKILASSKPDDLVRRTLNAFLPYGSSCIEHILLFSGLSSNIKVSDALEENNKQKILDALDEGEAILRNTQCSISRGYIVQSTEKKIDSTIITKNVEFHPILFQQHKARQVAEYDSFNKAVDEFFGTLESQQADLKVHNQEKNALKKLDNVRKDHEKRLTGLEQSKKDDTIKAMLVEMNLSLVDQAIKLVRTAIANQLDWDEIDSLLKDSQQELDPVALCISKLKLQNNEISVALKNVYNDESEEEDFADHEHDKKSHNQEKSKRPLKIDIDLGLSAYGNAKKYYERKKQADLKQQKTIDASEKAFKSAKKKTVQSLKEVATVNSIRKARKTFWFEKFLWFVSSENYIVIGGRDAQQNELLVKKYLKKGDIYVHADLHGATSCIVKNAGSTEIPIKTLTEAGTMAICHSSAWTAKVVTSAWWVKNDQVSKTAPSGEYLTTGSFLIRGKKNYLPPSYLVYGFGILFRVDDTCVWKHKDERAVKSMEECRESSPVQSSAFEPKGNEEDTIECIEEDSDSSSANSTEEVQNKLRMTGQNKDQENGIDDEEVPNTGNIGGWKDKASKNYEDQPQKDFPDTEIALQYTRPTGDKYQLEESFSESRISDNECIYLGDNEPVLLNKATSNNKQEQRQYLSAKQRRQLKKNKCAENPKLEDSTEGSSPNNNAVSGISNTSVQEGNIPLKRGQKHKMKKIKGKYKDQDEEERTLKMDILQQSQNQKRGGRRGGKNKKNNQQQTAVTRQQGDTSAKVKPKEENESSIQLNETPPSYQTIHSDKTESIFEKPVSVRKDDEQIVDSDEEKELTLQNEHLASESANILETLTGCPQEDDVILFALPMCAPYNTMQNYKFKVKLTPGNGKKGKSAKSAVMIFQNMRETSAQEKSHLKSIKDYDLTRNMPGKVKLSAPNLQLLRKKR